MCNCSGCNDIKKSVAGLESNIATLTKSVEGLVTAWNTAQGLVRFIKWSAGLVASLAAIWYAIAHWRTPS